MSENFILTSNELGSISSEAKDLKFTTINADFIYTPDSHQRLKNFLLSYQFLTILGNNCSKPDLGKKIKSHLLSLNKLYKESLRLNQMMNTTINFGKPLRMRKLNEWLVLNSQVIDEFISYVYPIGRQPKTYDPDEEGAHY